MIFGRPQRTVRLVGHEQTGDVGRHRQFPGPPRRRLDVCDGADAENFQLSGRPVENADRLDDRRADGVVRPHPAVDKFDPIGSAMPW